LEIIAELPIFRHGALKNRNRLPSHDPSPEAFVSQTSHKSGIASESGFPVFL
jgi:hypothetical protein